MSGTLAVLEARVILAALLWLVTTVENPAQAQSFHEFPADGDRVSGLDLLRGWACDADSITFSVDGAPFVEALYGFSRQDTASRCGDADNGYAFLISWSLLGRGVHHLVVRVDGQQIADLDFEVGGTGQEFVSGLAHRGVTYGVPSAQEFCTFQWQQATQNLQLAECARSRASGPGSDSQRGSRTIQVTSPTHGQQAYDVYVPTGYNQTRPIPLVVALHGAGGGAQGVRDQWALSAEPAEFIVVAPRAAGQDNVWEPGVDESWVAEVIEDVASRYNLERSRLYLWGFSAGGHFAHALGLFGTDTYAAYAVSAGTLGFAGPNAPQLAPRTIPVVLQVGNGDSIQVPFVLQDHDRFIAAGWVDDLNVHLDTFPGGHAFNASSVASAWRHLSLRVLPDP